MAEDEVCIVEQIDFRRHTYYIQPYHPSRHSHPDRYYSRTVFAVGTEIMMEPWMTFQDPGAKPSTEIQPQVWIERFRSSDGQRFDPQLLCAGSVLTRCHGLKHANDHGDLLR